MRRVVGVLASAALAFASVANVYASILPATLPAPDLGSQLMRRVFGESSDSKASFAAAYGDRASESPLRDLALTVAPSASIAGLEFDLAALPAFAQGDDPSGGAPGETFATSSAIDAAIMHSDIRFAAPSLSRDAAAASVVIPAAYQPVAPETRISPAPGTLAFGPLATASTQSTGALPSTRGPAASIPAPLQIGDVQFQGAAGGSTTETPSDALRDNDYGAGAKFDVRAGRRHVSLDLSSSYEHIGRNDSSTFSSSSLDSASTWELPNADAPLVVPNYADMNRFSVGAGLAVPVIHGVTLNLNYAAQRFYGGYGLPGLVNLDAINNSYGGKLTFAIPHTSGMLSIGASQDRYLDNVLPINAYTQTREDVNFTVKL